MGSKHRGPRHQVRLTDITAALLIVAAGRVVAAAPATRCVVHGDDVTLEALTVNGFTVGVSHVKADATMSSDRSDVTVDVSGVVAFRGTTTRLWYTVSTESSVGAGLVTMSPGAHLIGERLDGTAVSGAAVLYAADTLEGEDKPADEAVGTVSVPCDHLTLDWSHDPVDPPPPAGKGWRSRKDSLTFHAAPKASSPSVTYTATSCEEDCLTVQGDAAKNGYRKVGTVNESVSIVGWVKSTELQRIPGDEMFGHSYMCTGGHRGGSGSFGFSGPVPPVSLANLAPGTKIYDGPKGTTWATVTRDEVFEVRYTKGDTWAEIVFLPGLTDEAGHAYVPVSALVKPRPKPVSGTTR